MSKLKSKLFNKLELKKTELSSVTGGNYTSAGLDTNMAGGATDVTYESSNGNPDTVHTSDAGQNLDKPKPEIQ